MMEDSDKVFRSEIIRTENHYKNNLCDLIKIVPAKPLESRKIKIYACDFVPNTDKIYTPKRRLRAKVKTVKDIRTTFENDVYAYLPNILELQQNVLLKKIREGSSRNEDTIKVAKKLIQADSPIPRTTWQMLINLNPHGQVHARQFVLWNGNFIQVNGSVGGKNKLICNYDLAKTKLTPPQKKNAIKANISKKRRGLLRNSLAIKFKPGPLGRKKFLDDSHQKHQGDIELVDLPAVGLVVQPTYGTTLEPSIMHFISSFCREDGEISDKWAEFAVSALGKIERTNVKLFSNEPMTFPLNYKCDQNRLLMRKDLDTLSIAPKVINTSMPIHNDIKDQANILPDVTDMMSKILDAVEITINQDNMYTVDEDSIEVTLSESNTNKNTTTTTSKDKMKRKYGELGRLDVTVIRLPESCVTETTQMCANAYCSLGCVCHSINRTYSFKQHCGREECMFDCKCDFSKYTRIHSADGSDLTPGILNIEDEINMRLSKEEQKFHQTVIVTGENNILLKSEKRNWKSSKKYESFYKNMCLKNVSQKPRVLSISTIKLNCENIEPWCMVHNLYRCFCKGKFTESNIPILQNPAKDPINQEDGSDVECCSDKSEKQSSADAPFKHYPRESRRLRPNRTRYLETSHRSSEEKKHAKHNSCVSNKQRETISHSDSDKHTNKTYKGKSTSESSDSLDFSPGYNKTCSRVNAYDGRKYSDEHYKNTNLKIKTMEKNDKKLQQRILSILKADDNKEEKIAKDQNIEHTLEKCTEESSNLPKEPENEKELATIPEKVIPTESETEKPIEICSQKTVQSSNDHNLQLATVPEKVIPTESETDKPIEICSQKTTQSSNDHNIIKLFDDINYLTFSDGDISKRKLLPSQLSLVSWLEANYKLHKKRIDQGLVKMSLEPPKAGKIALHSWEFILSRYKERKNLFLISKQKPYRIFMGVHTRNPFFETCININEIRFADLHKYPHTVKNLLTNATDLKDNFCILRGLSHCWELVGSVSKVNKNFENTDEINDENSDIELNPHSNHSDVSDEQSSLNATERSDIQTYSLNENECQSNEADSSKWFIMTVENDFSEIRFYKKGFFVKYESIVKAINVACISGKTVRLSSQKCIEKNNGPQFGVYAIPNASEYCVFIGPYEMQDSLGIETIKSILDVRKQKRTRGFWINTSKVDNLKVIDNPLSFMPLSNFENKDTIPLENHFCDDAIANQNKSPEKLDSTGTPTAQTSLLKDKKVVKPIKIRKTNGFYHLATGQLKKIALSPRKILVATPVNSSLVQDVIKTTPDTIPKNNTIQIKNVMSLKSNDSLKDVSQIKISAVYSQKEEPTLNSNKTERGMFILKPEEINRKLLENQVRSEDTAQENVPMDCGEISNTELMNIDPEVPITGDAPCGEDMTDDNVFVISDDEDDIIREDDSDDDRWKDVLIQCTNVNDLGWIWGRRKCKSLLISFKVPGGDYSDFYTEQEAFQKLNCELSRIIGPIRPFNLNWSVVESIDEIEGEIPIMDSNRLHRVFEQDMQPSNNPVLQSLLTNNHEETCSNEDNPSTSRASVIMEPDDMIVEALDPESEEDEEQEIEFEHDIFT